jgi:hypothetical protein
MNVENVFLAEKIVESVSTEGLFVSSPAQRDSIRSFRTSASLSSASVG